MEGVPKPDVLVYNTNQCRDVQDWFAFYQREFDVPLHRHRDPRAAWARSPRTTSTASIGQHKALIPTLEEVSGSKFDIDRLREVGGLVLPLHPAVEEGAAHWPSTGPRRSPSSTARSTWDRPWCCAATPRAERLLRDADRRARGAHRRRRGRGRRREATASTGRACRSGASCATTPSCSPSQQACVVASTYCNSWIFEDLGRDDPFEGMARAYTELFIVRSEDVQGAVPRAAWSTTTRSTASSTTTPRPAPTTPTTATACPSG